jgi:mannan endo-1,4-beta-mannosidase
MANIWVQEWGSYALAAFRLYRNYDGKGGSYGDISVKTINPDGENMSIYASLDGSGPAALHVIVINKDFSNTQTARVTIKSKIFYTSGAVWGFDGSNEGRISQKEDIKGMKNNTLSIEIPPLAAYHIILNSKLKAKN